MTIRLSPFVLLTLLATPLAAEESAPTTQRMRTTTVFGDDPCPGAVAGEIIVCGRLPERERYRIPKALRDKKRDESGPNAAWGAKVETLESAQRFTLPGSCTAVGLGGQSGCTQAMLRQWFLERRAARAEGR